MDAGQGFAPAVLRDAVFGEEGASLGPVTLSEGSRVRVRILVKEGQAVPRVSLFATREGLPGYSRFMNSNGEAEAVLGGLGPGRFRIQSSAIMGPGTQGGARGAIAESHEIDGSTDLELTLDLR